MATWSRTYLHQRIDVRGDMDIAKFKKCVIVLLHAAQQIADVQDLRLSAGQHSISCGCIQPRGCMCNACSEESVGAQLRMRRGVAFEGKLGHTTSYNFTPDPFHDQMAHAEGESLEGVCCKSNAVDRFGGWRLSMSMSCS